jgi:hypothetical protein
VAFFLFADVTLTGPSFTRRDVNTDSPLYVYHEVVTPSNQASILFPQSGNSAYDQNYFIRGFDNQRPIFSYSSQEVADLFPLPSEERYKVSLPEFPLKRRFSAVLIPPLDGFADTDLFWYVPGGWTIKYWVAFP